MNYNFKFDENYAYCTMCGNRVGRRVGDTYIMSSSSEGDEGKGICHECLVEHCVNTNCLSCKLYEYTECPHIELKLNYLEG